jgi:hypothetical protein
MTRKKGESAESHAARSRRYRQENWRPTLIDLAILKQLPPEGSALGLHMIGATVPAIVAVLRKEYGDDQITSGITGGRLNSMKVMGHVIAVKLIPVSQGLGWQITEKGRQLLAEEGHKLEEVKRDGNT